jgi:hypothetical protein
MAVKNIKSQKGLYPMVVLFRSFGKIGVIHSTEGLSSLLSFMIGFMGAVKLNEKKLIKNYTMI